MHQISSFLHRELLRDWRKPSVLGGVLLYSVAATFIIFLILGKAGPREWSLLFWILLLFSSLQLVGRTFFMEDEAQHLYWYQSISAPHFFMGRWVYHFVLLCVSALLHYALFALLLGNPVKEPTAWIFLGIMGALAFSSTFTLLAGIAVRAERNPALMAIMGLPLIIPVMLLLSKASAQAASMGWALMPWKEILGLGALSLLTLGLSLILFPYLWSE